MTARAPDLAAALRALADAQEVQARALRTLAEALAADAPTAPASPRYASAKDNPIGASRPFLDAARAGAFPTFKRGREVSALWTDVEAWIEARKRPPRAAKPDPADDDETLLRKAGIKLTLPRAANDRGARR